MPYLNRFYYLPCEGDERSSSKQHEYLKMTILFVAICPALDVRTSRTNRKVWAISMAISFASRPILQIVVGEIRDKYSTKAKTSFQIGSNIIDTKFHYLRC